MVPVMRSGHAIGEHLISGVSYVTCPHRKSTGSLVMNKHVELVNKWLNDLESVSKENANEVNKMWVDEQPLIF